MLYAYHENFILPFSHDEVVHGKGSMIGKMPGDSWQKFATLRALYGFLFGHPGKKLLFMGNEIAQWWEWNHDSSLEWHLLQYAPHAQVQRLVKDLNGVYRREASLHQVDYDPSGFQWIDCSDNESSIVSFIRRARDPHDFTVLVLNFTRCRGGTTGSACRRLAATRSSSTPTRSTTGIEPGKRGRRRLGARGDSRPPALGTPAGPAAVVLGAEARVGHRP